MSPDVLDPLQISKSLPDCSFVTNEPQRPDWGQGKKEIDHAAIYLAKKMGSLFHPHRLKSHMRQIRQLHWDVSEFQGQSKVCPVGFFLSQ
jgi:hypothetical protein